MCYKRYVIYIINIIFLLFLFRLYNNDKNNLEFAEKLKKSLNLQDEFKIQNEENLVKLNLKLDNLKNVIEYNKGDYIIVKGKMIINKRKIKFPKIKNMNDMQKQKKINKMIKKAIRKVIKDRLIKIEHKSYFDLKYIIRFKNNDLLSVQFQGDYYVKRAPHPYAFCFGVNIDIKKNVLLKSDDIITVNGDITKFFLEKKFIGKNVISKSVYLKYLEYNDAQNIEAILKDAEVYFSKTGIVFIIVTTYAAGNYMLLELPYTLLEPV